MWDTSFESPSSSAQDLVSQADTSEEVRRISITGEGSRPVGERTGSGGSNGRVGVSGNTVVPNSTPRVRRRNRMITSCLECRRRKLKCDKSHPCL